MLIFCGDKTHPGLLRMLGQDAIEMCVELQIVFVKIVKKFVGTEDLLIVMTLL